MVHNLFQQFNLNLGFTGKYFLHNQNKKLFFIVCYIKCYMQIPSFGSSLQHNIIILTVNMFLGNLSLSQLTLINIYLPILLSAICHTSVNFYTTIFLSPYRDYLHISFWWCLYVYCFQIIAIFEMRTLQFPRHNHTLIL